MMATKLKNVIFFILCFSLGLSFFNSISEKVSTQRDPANADGKIFQITNLTSGQIKEQLQKRITVTPTINGKKTISFSDFSSVLCKTYSSIEIEFMAEGVSVDGEAPIMKINTPCAEAQNPAEIAAISLPIERILNEKPRNAEYSFEGFNAVVSFTNSADEWPRQWVLKRVEFKNNNGNNKTAEFNRAPASVNENTTERPIILEF